MGYFSFSSVWDYVPTETYLCRTRGGIRVVREDHGASIASTRVHAIFIKTLRKKNISETLDWATRGGPRKHQSSSDDRNSSRFWNLTSGDMWTHLSGRWRSDGSNSALMIVAHDRSSIVARSTRDRGTITTRSWHDHRAIVVKSPCDSGHDYFQVMGHDRHTIVAINSTSPPDQTAAIFGRKSSFQRRCIPSFFFSTFDWFMKQLSEFGAKS